MKKIGIMGRTLLPCLALAFALSACGGDDDDDDDSSDGGGSAVDAAVPADAMVPVDAAVTGSCVGEPAACDLSIGPFTCDAQVGCTSDTACIEDDLFYCGNLSEAACAESGCTWSSECEGAGLCFTETNELDCVMEPGCSWTSFCDPFSAPDNAHCPLHADEKSCTGDAVCDWEYRGCSGAPAPCSMLDEGACAGAAGCTWEP
jgi:hypothetical protein